MFLSLFFSHTFQVVRMKFDVLFKQLKLNILILLLSEIVGGFF